MFKCPECGSKNVRVEGTCMVEFKESGEWDPDDFDYSADGYAECTDCYHDGIVEDFS